MRERNFLLFFCSILFFQVILGDSLKVFDVRPDLILIAVVVASLLFKPPFSLLIGVCAGFWKDLFGLDAFGLNVVLFPLWSFSIVYFSKKISLDNALIRGVLAFVLIMLHNLCRGGLYFFLGNSIPGIILLRISFLEGVYTGLLTPLVFRVSLAVMYKRFRRFSL